MQSLQKGGVHTVERDIDDLIFGEETALESDR